MLCPDLLVSDSVNEAVLWYGVSVLVWVCLFLSPSDAFRTCGCKRYRLAEPGTGVVVLVQASVAQHHPEVPTDAQFCPEWMLYTRPVHSKEG